MIEVSNFDSSFVSKTNTKINSDIAIQILKQTATLTLNT